MSAYPNSSRNGDRYLVGAGDQVYLIPGTDSPGAESRQPQVFDRYEGWLDSIHSADELLARGYEQQGSLLEALDGKIY